MKSSPEKPSPGAIRLELKGSIPNLKNTKRVSGKRVFTDPEVKARMQEIIRDLELQLISVLRTCDDATPMELRRSSLMQSLPQDDAWTIIRCLIVNSELAPDDGATIWIERL